MTHAGLSMHANTHVHTHVSLLTFRAGIPAQDGDCYLVLDSVTYRASCQAPHPLLIITQQAADVATKLPPLVFACISAKPSRLVRLRIGVNPLILI
jgi:hypothetical protein